MYRATTKRANTKHIGSQIDPNAGNVFERLIPRVQLTRGAWRDLCIRMQESRDGLMLNHCHQDSLTLNHCPEIV
jgi:hypothetical protein